MKSPLHHINLWKCFGVLALLFLHWGSWFSVFTAAEEVSLWGLGSAPCWHVSVSGVVTFLPRLLKFASRSCFCWSSEAQNSWPTFHCCTLLKSLIDISPSWTWTTESQHLLWLTQHKTWERSNLLRVFSPLHSQTAGGDWYQVSLLRHFKTVVLTESGLQGQNLTWTQISHMTNEMDGAAQKQTVV